MLLPFGFSGVVDPSRTAEESSAIIQAVFVMAGKPTENFSGFFFFNYIL